MKIIVTFISLIFLLFFIFKKKENNINPFLVFYALWTLILFLSLFNLYGIKEPSDESYFLLLLMEVFFFTGYALRHYSHFLQHKNKFSQVKCRYKIIYILIIISLIINLLDCFLVIKNYVSGVPMWQIRNWILEPVGSINPILSRRSFLEEALRTIILTPFNLVLYPLSFYCLFFDKNKKIKISIIILSFLVLLTSSIGGGGGRLGFIYYFGCLLCTFILYYNQNKITADIKNKLKQMTKYIMLLMLVLLIIIVGMTAIRTGPGHFFKQFYTYFALPPTLLTVWLSTIKTMPLTYGMLTTFGIHSYFFRFLEKIGLKALIPNVYYNSYQYILNAEIFKNVGYGQANAFVTPIYYFMLDGGYLFVCLGSFLFGFLVEHFYRKFSENVNIKTFVMYMLILYGIFVSFMRIQTSIPTYIISFLMLFLLFENKKSKKMM